MTSGSAVLMTRSTRCSACRAIYRSVQAAEEFLGELAVRRVEHLRIGEGRLAQYRLAMAERLESPLAVVRAHTAVAHATEREPRHRDLEHQVVEHRAAIADLVEDAVLRTPILAEEVDRQRLGT